MNRSPNKRRVVLVLGLGLVGFGVWWFGVTREQLHKGRPISYWVNNRWGEVREIGAPAVPYLTERLRTKDTRWRTTWNNIHRAAPNWLSARMSPYEPALNTRVRAAELLGQLGPIAKPAIPELLQILENHTFPPESSAVLRALGAIGPSGTNALPFLRTNWIAASPLAQSEMALALWKIGRETNLVLTIFTNLMTTNSWVGLNCANGLRDMGIAGTPAVPILIQLLRNSAGDFSLRGNCAAALGKIGAVNEEVIPALLFGLTDTNRQVRGNSAISLWRLDTNHVAVALPIALEFGMDRPRFEMGRVILWH